MPFPFPLFPFKAPALKFPYSAEKENPTVTVLGESVFYRKLR
jgi:hypothetical protein